MEVKYIVHHTPYRDGDVANFNENTANYLIENGIAVLVDKSNVEEVIQNGTNKPRKGKGKASDT